MCKTSAKIQPAVLSHKIHDFCHCIFKKFRLHAGSANAPNLLFIHQDTAGCPFCLCHFQHSFQGRKGTHTVILSIRQNHAAVKSGLPGLACRHHFQFRRNKVFLFDAITLLQDIQNTFLYGILLCLFLCIVLFFLLINGERFVADDNIQRFPLDHFICLFLKLFLGQMNQQIRDKEHRIVLILTHIHFHSLAIFLNHHTMDGKRNGHPLVLLDTAIIMCVKISETAFLIHRILFHIQTRGIYMGSQDIHAVLHLFRANLEKNNGLIHPHRINLISGFQFLTGLHKCLQFLISCTLHRIHDLVDALSLGLAVI